MAKHQRTSMVAGAKITSDRRVRDIIRHAEAQGFEVWLGTSGHLKWRSPSGVVVTTAATPSDHRGYRNMEAKLRRLTGEYDRLT